MSGPVDIAQIVRMLADRAPDLARALLPRGRRQGHEWVEARRAQGGLGDSLAVRLDGPRAGVWLHGAAARSGDALDLIAYVATGDDKRAALAWARRWLGIDRADPAEIERRRQAALRSTAEAEAQAREEERRARGRAQALFLEARADIAGTPAAAYLAARGIEIARLGRPVRALRFHPRLWCEAARDHLPAMVAAIVLADGRFAAVHRTWLACEGGTWRKARLDAPKKVLGGFRGGAIRLWAGERADPETGEIRPGRRWAELRAGEDDPRVTIAEGIEDGLTAALACPERRVVAAVTIGNIANLGLPRALPRVTILAQNDAPGSPAAAALERAIAALQAEGRQVFLARPPLGVKDVNDLLNADRGAA